MDEHGRMMEAWRAAAAGGAPVVLATLVGVRGASYRSLGARMLILEDGTRIGSLSGGCIEGELCRRAFWWTEGGKPYLRTYDTSLQQEDTDPGYGLGCGGSVDVWLERLSAEDPLNPLLLADTVRTTRADRVTALVIRSSDETVVGKRFALDTCGSLCGASGCLPEHAPELVSEQMLVALKERSSRALIRTAAADVPCDIFVDLLRPPTQLFVFGAGFDAQPLVHFAAQLGWRVVVCDQRADFARPQRFPDAHQVLWVRTPEDLPLDRFDDSTACLVMTHSFEQDYFFLQQILPLALPYVGVLGSRDRTRAIFDELGAGIEESGVFAPTGLDIGAETPEEIALSIMAEIRACFSNRNGGSLRDSSNPIHTHARNPLGQEYLLLDDTVPLSNADLCKI